MRFLSLFLWISSIALSVFGLGCMPRICNGNDKNDIVGCEDGVCGKFEGARRNGEIAEGVDIKCLEDSIVYAPFDGNLSFYKPFERASQYGCGNEGAIISGIGQWQGYRAYIAPLLLDFFSGLVEKGQRIGVSKNYGCSYNVSVNQHIRFSLLKEKKFIDPTYHLTECMCTGQICETNPNNALLGKPFHYENDFNGVFGWKIKCLMVPKNEDREERAPFIYSPISAKWIGRTRLFTENDEYFGCDNNGLVLLGTGAWEEFEVRLYNVFYQEGIIAHQAIEQGQIIGTRLNCGNSPDIVFMEVRYRGRVVDISDLISAKSCKKPEL